MKNASPKISADEYLNQVKQLGKSHEEKLYLCYQEAISEFNEKHSAMMFLYNGRDYANNFHAHLRGRIRFHYRNQPDIYIDEKPGRAFTLIINGKSIGLDVWLVIRFKKITKGLKAANIPTKTVLDFFSQGQCEFIGFVPVIQNSLFPDPEMLNSSASSRITNLPKAHNLVAGYCPDQSWTSFELLGLTLPLSLKKSTMVNEFTSIGVTAVAASDVTDFPERRIEKTEKPKRVKQRQKDTKPIKQKLRKFINSKDEKIEEKDARTRKIQ